MAAPTAYTENTLTFYMHTVLGENEMGAALGWQPESGDYTPAIEETLLTYGVDDIAGISGRANIRKLRAIARVELWRLVMSRTAGDYDVKLDSDSYSRSQLHKQAAEMFAREQKEAARLGVTIYQQRRYEHGGTHVDYAAGYWSGDTS